MTPAKFTPGPWRNMRAIRKVVAELGFGPKSQQEANALLIAHAPELYHHLEFGVALPSTFDQYERFASDYRQWREKRDALLAKVRGGF